MEQEPDLKNQGQSGGTQVVVFDQPRGVDVSEMTDREKEFFGKSAS